MKGTSRVQREPEVASLSAENQLLRDLVTRASRGMGTVAETIGAEEQFAQLRERAKNLQSTLLVGEPGTGQNRLIITAHQLGGRTGQVVPVLCSSPAGHRLFNRDMSSLDSPFAHARTGTLLIQDVDALPNKRLATLRAWMDSTHDGRNLDTWVVATASISDRRLEGVFGKPILLPPVRERFDQLQRLVEALAGEMDRPDQLAVPRMHRGFVPLCRQYTWPGNIDELRSVVMQAVVLARRGALSTVPIPRTDDRLMPYREASVDFDHRVLKRALRASGGSVPVAAKLLELPISTFRYKLRRIGLEPKEEARY